MINRRGSYNNFDIYQKSQCVMYIKFFNIIRTKVSVRKVSILHYYITFILYKTN